MALRGVGITLQTRICSNVLNLALGAVRSEAAANAYRASSLRVDRAVGNGDGDETVELGEGHPCSFLGCLAVSRTRGAWFGRYPSVAEARALGLLPPDGFVLPTGKLPSLCGSCMNAFDEAMGMGADVIAGAGGLEELVSALIWAENPDRAHHLRFHEEPGAAPAVAAAVTAAVDGPGGRLLESKAAAPVRELGTVVVDSVARTINEVCGEAVVSFREERFLLVGTVVPAILARLEEGSQAPAVKAFVSGLGSTSNGLSPVAKELAELLGEDHAVFSKPSKGTMFFSKAFASTPRTDAEIAYLTHELTRRSKLSKETKGSPGEARLREAGSALREVTRKISTSLKVALKDNDDKVRSDPSQPFSPMLAVIQQFTSSSGPFGGETMSLFRPFLEGFTQGTTRMGANASNFVNVNALGVILCLQGLAGDKRLMGLRSHLSVTLFHLGLDKKALTLLARLGLCSQMPVVKRERALAKALGEDRPYIMGKPAAAAPQCPPFASFEAFSVGNPHANLVPSEPDSSSLFVGMAYDNLDCKCNQKDTRMNHMITCIGIVTTFPPSPVAYVSREAPAVICPGCIGRPTAPGHVFTCIRAHLNPTPAKSTTSITTPLGTQLQAAPAASQELTDASLKSAGLLFNKFLFVHNVDEKSALYDTDHSDQTAGNNPRRRHGALALFTTFSRQRRPDGVSPLLYYERKPVHRFVDAVVAARKDPAGRSRLETNCLSQYATATAQGPAQENGCVAIVDGMISRDAIASEAAVLAVSKLLRQADKCAGTPGSPGPVDLNVVLSADCGAIKTLHRVFHKDKIDGTSFLDGLHDLPGLSNIRSVQLLVRGGYFHFNAHFAEAIYAHHCANICRDLQSILKADFSREKLNELLEPGQADLSAISDLFFATPDAPRLHRETNNLLFVIFDGLLEWMQQEDVDIKQFCGWASKPIPDELPDGHLRAAYVFRSNLAILFLRLECLCAAHTAERAGNLALSEEVSFIRLTTLRSLGHPIITSFLMRDHLLLCTTPDSLYAGLMLGGGVASHPVTSLPGRTLSLDELNEVYNRMLKGPLRKVTPGSMERDRAFTGDGAKSVAAVAAHLNLTTSERDWDANGPGQAWSGKQVRNRSLFVLLLAKVIKRSQPLSMSTPGTTISGRAFGHTHPTVEESRFQSHAESVATDFVGQPAKLLKSLAVFLADPSAKFPKGVANRSVSQMNQSLMNTKTRVSKDTPAKNAILTLVYRISDQVPPGQTVDPRNLLPLDGSKGKAGIYAAVDDCFADGGGDPWERPLLPPVVSNTAQVLTRRSSEQFAVFDVMRTVHKQIGDRFETLADLANAIIAQTITRCFGMSHAGLGGWAVMHVALVFDSAWLSLMRHDKLTRRNADVSQWGATPRTRDIKDLSNGDLPQKVTYYLSNQILKHALLAALVRALIKVISEGTVSGPSGARVTIVYGADPKEKLKDVTSFLLVHNKEPTITFPTFKLQLNSEADQELFHFAHYYTHLYPTINVIIYFGSDSDLFASALVLHRTGGGFRNDIYVYLARDPPKNLIQPSSSSATRAPVPLTSFPINHIINRIEKSSLQSLYTVPSLAVVTLHLLCGGDFTPGVHGLQRSHLFFLWFSFSKWIAGGKKGGSAPLTANGWPLGGASGLAEHPRHPATAGIPLEHIQRLLCVVDMMRNRAIFVKTIKASIGDTLKAVSGSEKKARKPGGAGQGVGVIEDHSDSILKFEDEVMALAANPALATGNELLRRAVIIAMREHATRSARPDVDKGEGPFSFLHFVRLTIRAADGVDYTKQPFMYEQIRRMASRAVSVLGTYEFAIAPKNWYIDEPLQDGFYEDGTPRLVNGLSQDKLLAHALNLAKKQKHKIPSLSVSCNCPSTCVIATCLCLAAGHSCSPRCTNHTKLPRVCLVAEEDSDGEGGDDEDDDEDDEDEDDGDDDDDGDDNHQRSSSSDES